ncbi:MAG TPA: universal stress protein [Micromonosporaceae bacterium]|nr:universal stress protein [Micromonosporaceae bacterium]
MSSYRIVVGVDGSDGGRRALRWALREAATRGGTVQAVYAWRWDEVPPNIATTRDQEQRRAEETLLREVESVREQVGAIQSEVKVDRLVMEGRAADVLTAAARDADLLVLGSHGHSRVRVTVLGSVSEECVRKGTCPIVVLPVPKPAHES